ncbi:hypothetical protein [Pseudonocardia sp. HH130630-07]|uniref:hypothetical protein n=1 Tax=Pseudonocardia sp. HH130630-07 TaxID=1690815 RepID=UPI000814FC0A|nr:hypothetical protein [Pseudonocardia sp. HH130630-07]ANY06631.1 hypothetical protein AFB00_10365 [Pseudonocardia sp. HH130630-07]
MIAFDAPDVLVPIPLDGTADSIGAAVRSAVPGAPEDVVTRLTELGLGAVRQLARAEPFYAGVVLTRTDNDPPQLSSAQLVASTEPLDSPRPPDADLTVHLLRRQYGADNVDRIDTPLGPGFLVVADQRFRTSTGPMGEPVDERDVTVRSVCVQIPVPAQQVVLVLTLSVSRPSEIETYARLLAPVIGTLRTTVEPTAARSPIRDALDP